MKFAPALAILWLAAIPVARADDLGSMQGRVINFVGGGIAGVVVEIKSGLAEAHTTTTDQSGWFRFAGLKYGAYGYTATREGYSVFSISSSGRVGPDPASVEIQMAEPTTIRGRVLDDSGQPSAHVCVQIYRGRDCDVTTDSAGAFRFPNVRPGVYTLVAKPQADDRPTRADGLASIATNYPSVVEREFAEPIIVRPGAQLADFEIRLRASHVFRLSGTVVDAAGKPVPAAKLRLLSPHPNMRSYSADVVGPAPPEEELAISALADGSFAFTSVRPGNWVIEAELDPVNDPIERDLEPTGSELVTVSSKDVDAIVVHLADPFQLEYVEDWGQGVPPTRDHSSPVNLLPQEGQERPPIPGAPRSFDLVLPGQYRIVPQDYSPGFYTSSITLNGRDVLNQEAELAPGGIIKVVYRPAARVRGIVETKVAATVMLVAASLSAGGSGVVLSTPVGEGGAFDIADVPPGAYVIAAFSRIDELLLRTPLLIDRIFTRATNLRVREDEISFVQLKLSPWP